MSKIEADAIDAAMISAFPQVGGQDTSAGR
jgi:hypothetical protein